MGIRTNRYFKPDHHRCLLYPMNVGGYNYFGKTRLADRNYLFLIYFSQKLSLKFLVFHRPAPVSLFYCREYVPTYEFYDLSFSRALHSPDVVFLLMNEFFAIHDILQSFHGEHVLHGPKSSIVIFKLLTALITYVVVFSMR